MENYLIPVSKSHRCKTVSEQLTKISEEVKEAKNALLKLSLSRCQNADIDTLKELAHQAALELGDIIIASITTLDMIGFNPESILKEVYVKNNRRGYYD